MEPNPEKYPLLHYILSQQNSKSTLEPDPDLLLQMPYLTHPEMVQSMITSVSDIIQTRLFVTSLSNPPSSDTVASAVAKITEIETELENWADIEDKEELERDLQLYKAVIRLDETHQEYDKKLQSREKRLSEVYLTMVEIRRFTGRLLRYWRRLRKGKS